MSRRRTIVSGLILCAAAAILPACDSPTDPSDENLRLVGQISRNVIPPSATAVLTFRLENTSDDTITLRFTSGCQILPYITRRSDNRIVHPAGGTWSCPAVISELILRPGGAQTHEVTVQGVGPAIDPAPGNVGLLPGDYLAYARVEATGITLQSESVPFTVQ